MTTTGHYGRAARYSLRPNRRRGGGSETRAVITPRVQRPGKGNKITDVSFRKKKKQEKKNQKNHSSEVTRRYTRVVIYSVLARVCIRLLVSVRPQRLLLL